MTKTKDAMPEDKRYIRDSLNRRAECPDCDGEGYHHQPTSVPDDDGEAACRTCGGLGYFIPYKRLREVLKERDKYLGDALYICSKLIEAGYENLDEALADARRGRKERENEK